MRLKGKTALVTGATGGIGTAIADRFRREGAELALTGRREQPDSLPQGSLYLAGDIRDEQHVAYWVEQALERFGRLDILVNVHGIQPASPLHEVELSSARDAFDVNVIGAFLTMKHVIPPMLESGGGSIVNIASRLGMVGMPGQTIYSASKGALIMLSKGAALEYAPRGVRVNVVSPGLTATPIIRDSFRRRPDPDAYLRSRENSIPLRRLATPEEVANAALFIASDESSYITGAVLPVDGGYTAG